jgi:hypothetical protein
MVTANDVLNKLFQKADKDSCLYCSNLRIHKNEVWCKRGLIDKFNILDILTVRKISNKIKKHNDCAFNDSFFEHLNNK